MRKGIHGGYNSTNYHYNPESKIDMTQEEARLAADRDRLAHWKRWGPYLSERQWGTVRENYSSTGLAWDYFTHEQARSRAYQWGEDGIAGISDNHQLLCFAIALWNGKDAILKERIFGSMESEGHHGEKVKEYYYYLDNTPTHSYMKYLYKYPQNNFPYPQIDANNYLEEFPNSEVKLLNTSGFNDDRYFDVFVEYAKNSPDDILIKISMINRGPETETLHLLPTLWFRNTWSWNSIHEKPSLKVIKSDTDFSVIEAFHPTLGNRWLYCDDTPELLFTENETNYKRLYGVSNSSSYVKDGINDYLVHGYQEAVNLNQIGTKSSAHYKFIINTGETRIVRLRLTKSSNLIEPCGADFDKIFQNRIKEADEFYDHICPFQLSDDLPNMQRQAFAGMLWNKQFYYYVWEEWLKDNPAGPPSPEHKQARDLKWIHLFNDDILLMPDKQEYPCFAAGDLACHLISLAMVDPDLAKYQMDKLTREWYTHPDAQIPVYEWAFGDVSPHVQAWAAMRIYQIERKMYGRADKQFLECVFQKLQLNFTWWINGRDIEEKNVFQNGVLEMDNISIFDRKAESPTSEYINQLDGTSGLGMYCLNMLAIAIELAKDNSIYEDIASRFCKHFLHITDAIDGISDA